MALRRHRLGAALLLTLAALPLRGQDGLGRMWTFERPPLDYFEREYGFRPDAEWLRTVMLASLKLGNGCSASFVSPQGLILTNHHCVRTALAEAQGAADWLRDGFVAADLAAEVPLQGLTAQQLVRTSDVTERMAAGIGSDTPPDRAAALQRKNREAILAEASRAEPQLRAQIVALFQGARWQLYQYRVFDDLRLCLSPHLQIAAFGGDPDNFTFPRFCIDFAFCRAYVDGKPADTSAGWLQWKDAGARDGEVVFLTGNPGGTKRLLTAAQLDCQRDGYYPRMQKLIDNRLGIMRGFAAQDPAMEKRLRPLILSYENGQKLFRGEHAVLRDAAFQARKRAAESEFAARMAARPELQALHGHLIGDLQAVAQRRLRLDAPLHFHGAGGSPLLLRALHLHDFAASGDEAKAKAARAVRCGDDPVQRAFFVDHLTRAAAALPPGDPFLAAMLRGEAPAAAVARLERDSRLGDAAVVDALLAGGRTAITGSADPALQVARVLAPQIADNKRAASALDAEEQALGAALAQALFAIHGDGVSPDATGTLRLSDGRVRGYDCNGTLAPWRTVFHGLYARHAEFEGKPPFDLPDAWLQAESRIDLRAAVNFVCTVDSTGGNSGSPVIDRDRRLVGLLFDGNIESLANEFLFGERVERSVCVHPQAIVEALAKVYAGQRLLQELRGGR